MDSKFILSNLGEAGGGEMGLNIARFRNDEILQNSETVARRIKELIMNEQG